MLGAGPVLAEQCVASMPAITLCKRCRLPVTAITSAGVACFGTPPAQQMGGRVLLESKVISQPKNGRAHISNGSWHYTPKPGFTGRDSFVIERNYIEAEQLFVTFVDITMDVKPR